MENDDCNELNNYEILGLSSNATYNEVKNNYHLLSRYYHPDSHYKIPGLINLSKEEKKTAYQKITNAYHSLKKKLKVNEIDLPKLKINYEEINVKKYKDFDKLIENFNLNNNDNFKIFNEKFEEYHKIQAIDEPYSIYYFEPEESERNLCESIIEINESNFNNDNNNYEFGVNYVEDHSTEKFRDSRYFDDSEYLNDSEYLENFNNSSNNSSNNSISIESLLENLIKERENVYNEVKNKNNKEENNEVELKKEILSSKQKIDKKREERLFIE